MMARIDQPRSVLSRDGQVSLYDRFIGRDRADRLLAALLADIDWRREYLTVCGRRVAVPRLVAWYGDPGANYRYAGLDHRPLSWTAPLSELRGLLEHACGVAFNSVLLNLYRDGADGMGWHSDDEPELGERPLIASLSLGGPRRFRFRHKARARPDVDLTLGHGSLLLMAGDTQRHWRHAVPKTRRPVAARVNLSFRRIVA